MRAELFDQPLPLTEEEKKELKSRLIKKHDYTTIWIHWLNAAVWATLLPTGAALINSAKYSFVPLGFSAWVSSIFQGRENLLQFHIWTGVLWAFVLLSYAIFGARRYLPIAKEIFSLNMDDIKWQKAFFDVKILGKSLEMPPQGFFNAGQKMVGMTIYLMTPTIMVSGLIMSFQLLDPWLIQWSILAHFIAVGLICLGLPVHIFMAGVYAPEREALKSMITGYINEYFAYKHNWKFWRTVSAFRDREEKDEFGTGVTYQIKEEKSWGGHH